MRGNIGAGIFDTISIGPKRRLCGFYSVVAKTVLYLSTTWLRVALLHSPASASTALPGFFMGGMWWFIALFWLTLIMIVVAAAGGELLYSYAERRKWRFSLRTLLIAMTVIAVLLGIAAYAARK